jgi:hypothetical protein
VWPPRHLARLADHVGRHPWVLKLSTKLSARAPSYASPTDPTESSATWTGFAHVRAVA